jgi:hypothetical protein
VWVNVSYSRAFKTGAAYPETFPSQLYQMKAVMLQTKSKRIETLNPNHMIYPTFCFNCMQFVSCVTPYVHSTVICATQLAAILFTGMLFPTSVAGTSVRVLELGILVSITSAKTNSRQLTLKVTHLLKFRPTNGPVVEFSLGLTCATPVSNDSTILKGFTPPILHPIHAMHLEPHHHASHPIHTLQLKPQNYFFSTPLARDHSLHPSCPDGLRGRPFQSSPGVLDSP